MSSYTAALGMMFIDYLISPECVLFIYDTSLYMRDERRKREQEREDVMVDRYNHIDIGTVSHRTLQRLSSFTNTACTLSMSFRLQGT